MDVRQRVMGAAVRLRVVGTSALVCALACVLPSHALASSTQQSILLDDQHLIYSPPDQVARTLAQIASLGVDEVKVSVVWSIVAPHPGWRHRPRFDASDPAAYPQGAWDRYDLIVRLAQQLGLGVYFQITPPAPEWAHSQLRPTQGYTWSHLPSDRQYREFVHAIGERYSGTYAAPLPPGDPPALGGAPAPPARIPRVSEWGIWNEPNEGAWLNPQYRVVGAGRAARKILLSPGLYRGLVDAGWKALAATGHASDTVLIGETASHGWIYPPQFVRALYCVGPALRSLTGPAAAEVRCPRSGNPGGFVAAHPGLFDAAGYAHHPYSFDMPPNARPPIPGEVTLANLPSFERLIDRIFGRYGRLPPEGVPMYMTEWGYKTDPPNPFVKTSPAQQATYLNQGEYMAFRDPHLHSLAQFLLLDTAPNAAEPVGSRAYWGTFQTGLLTASGIRKPAYAAYRIPIWLPVARHGRRVVVWGQLRPANHAAVQHATLQLRLPGSGAWREVREVATANARGFLLAHVTIESPGTVRLAWSDPQTGQTYYSRSVTVS
ncbi:MAG: hypothetical protein ACR2LV_09480 [Solirubrobacteraceae bacterium]